MGKIKTMHKARRVKLTDLSPHLLCVLCSGYLIDATTIIECLHSFCRKCIIRYLESSKYCPICEVQVHKTRPLDNLRSDKTLQDLVYKLVPGLFRDEMQRRRTFYKENPDAKPSSRAVDVREERGEVYGSRLIFTEEEKISLILQNCDRVPSTRNPKPSRRNEKGCDRRYLLCPAAINIGHLKKFIKCKFDLGDKYEIELFHTYESLKDDCTLMDVAYISGWRRVKPLRLRYVVFEEEHVMRPEATCKVKHIPIANTLRNKKKTTKKKRGRPPGTQLSLLHANPANQQKNVETSPVITKSPGVSEMEGNIQNIEVENTPQEVIDIHNVDENTDARRQSIENDKAEALVVRSGEVDRPVSTEVPRQDGGCPSSPVPSTSQADETVDAVREIPTNTGAACDITVDTGTEAQFSDTVSCKLDKANNNDILVTANKMAVASQRTTWTESTMDNNITDSSGNNTSVPDSTVGETKNSLQVTNNLPRKDSDKQATCIVNAKTTTSESFKICSQSKPVIPVIQSPAKFCDVAGRNHMKSKQKGSLVPEDISTSSLKAKANISSQNSPVVNVAQTHSICKGATQISQSGTHSNLTLSSRPRVQLTMTSSGIKIHGTPVKVNSSCQPAISSTPLASFVLVPTSTSKGQPIQVINTPVSAFLPITATTNKPQMVKLTAASLHANGITIQNNQLSSHPTISAKVVPYHDPVSNTAESSKTTPVEELKTNIPTVSMSLAKTEKETTVTPIPIVSDISMSTEQTTNNSKQIDSLPNVRAGTETVPAKLKTAPLSQNMAPHCSASTAKSDSSSHVRNIVTWCFGKTATVPSTTSPMPIQNTKPSPILQAALVKPPINTSMPCSASPRKQATPMKLHPGGPILPTNKSYSPGNKRSNKAIKCVSNVVPISANDSEQFKGPSLKSPKNVLTTCLGTGNPLSNSFLQENKTEVSNVTNILAGKMPESHFRCRQASPKTKDPITPKTEHKLLCKDDLHDAVTTVTQISANNGNATGIKDTSVNGDSQGHELYSPTSQGITHSTAAVRKVPDYTRYRYDVVTTKLANDRKAGDEADDLSGSAAKHHADIYRFDDSSPSSPAMISNNDSNKDKAKSNRSPTKCATKTNSPSKHNRTSPKRTPQTQKRACKANDSVENNVKRLNREHDHQADAQKTIQAAIKQVSDVDNSTEGSSSINYVPNTLKIKMHLGQPIRTEIFHDENPQNSRVAISADTIPDDIGERCPVVSQKNNIEPTLKRPLELTQTDPCTALSVNTGKWSEKLITNAEFVMDTEHSKCETRCSTDIKAVYQHDKEPIEQSVNIESESIAIHERQELNRKITKVDPSKSDCPTNCYNPTKRFQNDQICPEESTCDNNQTARKEITNPVSNLMSFHAEANQKTLNQMDQPTVCRRTSEKDTCHKLSQPPNDSAFPLIKDTVGGSEHCEQVPVQPDTISCDQPLQNTSPKTTDIRMLHNNAPATSTPSNSLHCPVSSVHSSGTSVGKKTQGRIEKIKSPPRPTSAPPLQKSIPTHKQPYPRPEIISKLIRNVSIPSRLVVNPQTSPKPASMTSTATAKATPVRGCADPKQTQVLSGSQGANQRDTNNTTETIYPNPSPPSSRIQQPNGTLQKDYPAESTSTSQYMTTPMAYSPVSTYRCNTTLSVPTTHHAAAADEAEVAAAVSLVSMGWGHGINHSDPSHARAPQAPIQANIASPDNTEGVATEPSTGMRDYWSSGKGRTGDVYHRKVSVSGKTYDGTDAPALKPSRIPSSPNNSTLPRRQNTEHRKHSEPETPPIKKLKLMCNGITFERTMESNAKVSPGHRNRQKKAPKQSQPTNPSIAYNLLSNLSGFPNKTNFSGLYDMAINSSNPSMPNGQAMSCMNITPQHSMSPQIPAAFPSSPPCINGPLPLPLASSCSSFYGNHFRHPSPGVSAEKPSVLPTSPLATPPLTCWPSGNGYDAPLELTTKTSQDRHKERERERRTVQRFVETEVHGSPPNNGKGLALQVIQGSK